MSTKLDNPMHSSNSQPRLKNFAGQTMIIKCGGNVLSNPNTVAVIVKQILELANVGVHVVLIHGGGSHINTALNQAGIQSKKVEGLRVTDEATLQIVINVFANINKNLVENFLAQGLTAKGLCLPDESILQADKLKLKNNSADLGFVGEIKTVNKLVLEELLANGKIPVIAPIGKDDHGNFYNINADHAACAIAAALKADRLIFLTDVAGVLADADHPGSRIAKIETSEIPQYINGGSINGGMLPKLQSCLHAIRDGVKEIVILNGLQGEAVICALLYPDRFGTLIKENVQ